MNKSHGQKGSAPIIAIIIAIIVIGVIVFAVSKDKKVAVVVPPTPPVVTPEPVAIPRTIEFDLNEQNKSGEKGHVTISEENGVAKIVVTTSGTPGVVPQPAHIHLATCTKIGGVKYPLTNIENGSSVTTLAVSIDDLLKDLPLAVNVHKSATAATVYVACGDIPAPATDTMMNTSSTTTTGVTGNATPGGLVTEVVIVNYSATGFSPKDISVKAGQTVRFVNTTASGMSVASDDHPAHTIYPEFDQWKDAKYKGQKTYEFTFTKVGTWAYHNHMKETDGGTVNVK